MSVPLCASTVTKSLATTDLEGRTLPQAARVDIEREVKRCRHDGIPLTIGQLHVNGHAGCAKANLSTAESDELLSHFQARLCTDHLVVPVSAAGLLCAMPGWTSAQAWRCLSAIAGEIATIPEDLDLHIGLATLQPDEDSAALIARVNSGSPLPTEQRAGSSRRRADGWLAETRPD